MSDRAPVQAALRKAIRVAAVTVGLKGTLSLVNAVRKSRKPSTDAAWDSVRLGLFVGALSGGFRLSELALRRVAGPRMGGAGTAAAGALVGLAMLLDDPGRRQTVALYALANAANMLFGWGVARGAVPDVLPGGIPSYYILLLCACAAWTQMAIAHHPETFFPTYRNFLRDFGKIPKDRMDEYLEMYEEQQRRLEEGKRASDERPYRGFCGVLHKGFTCWSFALFVWFRAFQKGMRFYLPIHFFGFLMGGLKQPVSGAKRMVTGAFWSSVFLASYVMVVHRIWCWLRLWSERESPAWLGIGGFLCGFSILAEHQNRRPEMALWFLPQVWKSVWGYAEKRRWVRSIENGEVLLFCGAMAYTMYCYRHQRSTVKSTYLKLLDLIF